MDFTEYKCPICNEQFKKDEDIVVCPECGTPQHRVCYEELNHCYYQDKHKEGFSFEETHDNVAEDDSNTTVTCPRCKAVNPKEIFYCQNCGLPLGNQNNNNNNSDSQSSKNQYGQPFGQPNGMPPFGAGFSFDPMAGIDSTEPIADDITAGEMSKFVGKSTPYYLMVFKKLKNLNASRYNFAAFLFTGVYFLYRKMIGLGILFSSLIIGLDVATYYVYLTPAYQEIYQTLSQNNSSAFYSPFYLNTSMLSMEQLIILSLPGLFSILSLAISIICGAIANRCYYKHCSKTIKKMKSEECTEPINDRLERRGGVNIALALCIGVVYIAITYIPYFISM